MTFCRDYVSDIFVNEAYYLSICEVGVEISGDIPNFKG